MKPKPLPDRLPLKNQLEDSHQKHNSYSTTRTMNVDSASERKAKRRYDLATRSINEQVAIELLYLTKHWKKMSNICSENDNLQFCVERLDLDVQGMETNFSEKWRYQKQSAERNGRNSE